MDKEEMAGQGGAAGTPAAPQSDGEAATRPAPQEGDPAQRLQEAEERAQRFMANWQRAQADLSNYRKQAERDREELAARASALAISPLLSVLDDLERAMGSVAVPLRGLTWVEGVWLIYRKLEALLQAQGLEELRVEKGQPFDPRVHQAVAEVEGQEGLVAEVVQRGYSLGQHLLRPALVAVGKGVGQQSSSRGAAPEGRQAGGDQDADGGPADGAGV